MEVGNQGIYDLKGIARHNKERRIARTRLHVPESIRSTFEGAKRGGTDGDHTASRGFRVVNALGNGLWHVIPLRVHMVFGEIFNTHWLERTGPDMERHVFNIHPFVGQSLKKRIGEVQPSRGRSHGARVFGIHRLVATLIGLIGRMGNVRG